MTRLTTRVTLAGLILAFLPFVALAKGKAQPEAAVVVHRHLNDACSLIQSGKLISAGSFAYLQIDGISYPVYSPELSPHDFLVPTQEIPRKLRLLAFEMGFHFKRDPSNSHSGTLPYVEPSSTAAACPTVPAAIQAAEKATLERVRVIESKVYQPLQDHVTLAFPVPPPQSALTNKNTSAPQNVYASSSGTILLSAVINPMGKLENLKVIQSSNPKMNSFAEKEFSKWSFGPGRKDGLPVSVRIVFEFVFHPKH
jgi:TonB family protein